ncbi:adhesion G protein-coupled receptor L3-like isoform X2 [Acropora palmata]|uniref:adhesion G protein-coupled receptor L3-like isoform X2 n=1 Tax=Acropora palmata TaxID=6131 RepID=UPI003DA1104E
MYTRKHLSVNYNFQSQQTSQSFYMERRKKKNILSLFLAAQVILFRSFLCTKAPEKVFAQRWLNIRGSAVDQDFTTSPSFQNKSAYRSKYLPHFRQIVQGFNYVARYRSYLVANGTGNFTFFTCCDDTCKLFLSNGNTPSNKRMIIHQTTHVSLTNCYINPHMKPFQISNPQYLVNNKVYFIEVLLKQGIGNDGMVLGIQTPSGEMKAPIPSENLLKSITEKHIPEEYCVKTGDPNYPDYIKDCSELSDSSKINEAISILKDLQSRVNEGVDASPDDLLQIMKTAGKKTSKLLESFNDTSFLGNQSDRVFEIAREVEKLGSIIASRITNTSVTIAVNYSSIYMEASKREDRFFFDADPSATKEHGSRNSIAIILENSGNDTAHFFSALYRNLDKIIQHNISDVQSEESSSQPTLYFLNSKIISGSVFQTSKKSFRGKVTIQLSHTKYQGSDKETMQCAFWQNSKRPKNPNGYWSTEGCYKDEQLSNDQATVCHCNHLTNFAILMRVKDIMPSKPHLKALEVITYVGCSLSLLGEIITILTLTFLKLTRSETSVIHLNLVAALAAAQIIFLSGIEATQNKAACKIVAVLLHYFNLVSFTWMLIEGIWLYVMIVRVFENGHSRIKKYCACAWGIPFVFVVITLSASFDGYGTNTSCWLSVQKGTIWSFVVPVLLIALANSIILGMVMREILRLNQPATTENFKYQTVRCGAKSAIVLLPLLGITWIFGVLTFNSETVAFQYLFATFNSLQGFFIFLFHCLLNSEVRRVFDRKKKIWSESHDMLQTNSLPPQNYNGISKETLSTRSSQRPGSGGSGASNVSKKPPA